MVRVKFTPSVSVSHGQLHASLQDVPEIVSVEGQDARELTAEHFDKPTSAAPIGS